MDTGMKKFNQHMQAGWNPGQPLQWAKDHPEESRYDYEARVIYYHCEDCTGHEEYVYGQVCRCIGAVDADIQAAKQIRKKYAKKFNFAIRAITLQPYISEE